MNLDLTDPRAFFDTLEHELGDKARPDYLAFREGEEIVREGEHVRRLLMMRYGEADLTTGGRRICTYVADQTQRRGAMPIISASDYCYSTPSGTTAVARTDVEILAFDTRVLKDMGRRGTIFVLFRNLLLFSDMGVPARRMLQAEFDRTGMFCFDPGLPEDKILRLEPETCEEYYLDFGLRAMSELMTGRIVRAREDLRSTAISALPRHLIPSRQGRTCA